MLSDETYSRGLSVIFASHLGLKDPGATAKIAAKHLLDDIPEDIFIQACDLVAISKETPWSVVASIRDEAKKIVGYDSESSYAIIEKLLKRYYHPDFGQCLTEIIEMKLVEIGRRDLIPFLHKWGPEIYSDQNPTGTRANFRKAFEIEQTLNGNGNGKLKSGSAPKQIADIIDINTLKPSGQSRRE